jgi:hypothetical protein
MLAYADVCWRTQASLCRQLMLHALHNIQAFALHEPLPADVRQKLVEIATVQSAKMEEELRVGGGGGGTGGGGGGGAAMGGVQPDMMSGLVLLAYAGVCWRMLAYTGVCWHIC